MEDFYQVVLKFFSGKKRKKKRKREDLEVGRKRGAYYSITYKYIVQGHKSSVGVED